MEYVEKTTMLDGPEISGLQSVAEKIHRNSIIHGWWQNDDRSIPEMLCLIHSEVSEALEDYRADRMDHIGEELADIMIRVMDMAVGLGIEIGLEINNKHLKNIVRPYRHGGKKC